MLTRDAPIISKEQRCVVHFFHRDFRRCKIMDGHLEVRSVFSPARRSSHRRGLTLTHTFRR